MKTAVLKILTFSFILTTAVSCKKSDPVSPVTPKSKTTLLTQSSWKVQSFGIDDDKNGVIDPGSDYTSSSPACKLDNRYSFKTDGTGIADEAAAKCDPADAQSQPFTWTFKTNETILNGTFNFTAAFSNGDATILSLTETDLVVSYYASLGSPAFYTVVINLKH